MGWGCFVCRLFDGESFAERLDNVVPFTSSQRHYFDAVGVFVYVQCSGVWTLPSDCLPGTICQAAILPV